MIEVKNLTKKYGAHVAVDDLSFTVLDGEIVGFLGPNGAGKTTTMNIMTGYLSPTDGTVTINGHDIIEEPAKAKTGVGYLPDTPPLYNNMLVGEYLDFVADIKKIKKAGRKEHIAEIMESVKITDMKGRLIKNLSKGYRQRVGLAQAMLGNPDVIILDEPTVGLDPKQIIEMRDVIKTLGKRHTVILSSHILSEVSAVCDRVMIINKGRIVASDTPEGLSSNLSSANKIMVRVKAEDEKAIAALTQSPLIGAAVLDGVREEGTCDILIDGAEGEDIREAAFNILAEHKMPILMMKNMNLSLEEIFLQITTKDAADPLEGIETGLENHPPQGDIPTASAPEESLPDTAPQEIPEEKEEGGPKSNDSDL